MPIERKPDLDGAMTVSQTEAECEKIQRGGFQLTEIHFDTKIEGGTTFLINRTLFKEKLIGRLRDLHFYEIKTDDDIEEVKEAKKELGWTFILKSKIYVGNPAGGSQTKDVLIFGKKS